MTDRPLTVDEAIEFLGVSDKTVRRMLKDGLLVEAERDVRGRILIAPESLSAAAELIAARKGDTERQGNIVLASQSALMDRTIERYTLMVDERDAIIRTLTDEAATLREQVKHMIATDQLKDMRDRITELENIIAEARRPVTDQADQPAKPTWWERLTGSVPKNQTK